MYKQIASHSMKVISMYPTLDIFCAICYYLSTIYCKHNMLT